MSNPGGRNPSPAPLPETLLIGLQQQVAQLQRVRVDRLYPERGDLIFQSSPLFAGAETDLNLPVFKSARLLSLSVSAPCRIRAYGTEQHREDDRERAYGVFPAGFPAIELDAQIIAGKLTINLPMVSLVNFDIPAADTIYFTLENTTTNTQEYTLVMTLRREE